jgi:hypothetical protein
MLLLGAGSATLLSWQFSNLERNWTSIVDGRERRLGAELQAGMTDLVRRGHAAADQAAAAMAAARTPSHDMFRFLSQLRDQYGVDALALYTDQGGLLAWAGEHRGTLPDSIWLRAARPYFEERPLFSYLYFPVRVAGRDEQAIAAMLIETGVVTDEGGSLGDVVAARTATRASFRRGGGCRRCVGADGRVGHGGARATGAAHAEQLAPDAGADCPADRAADGARRIRRPHGGVVAMPRTSAAVVGGDAAAHDAHAHHRDGSHSAIRSGPTASSRRCCSPCRSAISRSVAYSPFCCRSRRSSRPCDAGPGPRARCSRGLRSARSSLRPRTLSACSCCSKAPHRRCGRDRPQYWFGFQLAAVLVLATITLLALPPAGRRSQKDDWLERLPRRGLLAAAILLPIVMAVLTASKNSPGRPGPPRDGSVVGSSLRTRRPRDGAGGRTVGHAIPAHAQRLDRRHCRAAADVDRHVDARLAAAEDDLGKLGTRADPFLHYLLEEFARQAEARHAERRARRSAAVPLVGGERPRSEPVSGASRTVDARPHGAHAARPARLCRDAAHGRARGPRRSAPGSAGDPRPASWSSRINPISASAHRTARGRADDHGHGPAAPHARSHERHRALSRRHHACQHAPQSRRGERSGAARRRDHLGGERGQGGAAKPS